MTATSSRMRPVLDIGGRSERRERELGPRPRLLTEQPLGTAERRVSLVAAVPDGGQTDAAELRERAHHVEDHARLARLVEVQAVADRDVEQIVDPETAQPRALEMVRRDEMLLAPARRGEQRGAGVVLAVGQELEREERVRRAALAQVELDRVGRPRAVSGSYHDEVHREAPQHALLRHPLSDLGRLPGYRPGVAEVGGESAAEVRLAARAAEHLVVGREQLDLP